MRPSSFLRDPGPRGGWRVALLVIIGTAYVFAAPALRAESED